MCSDFFLNIWVDFDENIYSYRLVKYLTAANNRVLSINSIDGHHEGGDGDTNDPHPLRTDIPDGQLWKAFLSRLPRKRCAN